MYALSGAAALGASAPAAAADNYLVDRFMDVCVGGEGRFPAGSLRPVPFQDLPRGARAALGHGGRDDAEMPISLAMAKAEEVPNRLFRITGIKAYLMIPLGSAGPAASFASQCAVLWQGPGFEEALVSLRAWQGIALAPLLPRRARRGRLTSEHHYLNGYVVTVLNHGGWVMMRSRPGSRPDYAPSPGSN